MGVVVCNSGGRIGFLPRSIICTVGNVAMIIFDYTLSLVVASVAILCAQNCGAGNGQDVDEAKIRTASRALGLPRWIEFLLEIDNPGVVLSLWCGRKMGSVAVSKEVCMSQASY